MTKEEFYTRIACAVSRDLTVLEVTLLDIACEPDPVDKRRLEYEVEEGMRSTIKGRIPEFVDLDDVPARAADGNYGYWLYDRKTKTWLIGMSNGTHEHLAGLLYGILTGDGDSVFSLEDNAEKYIDEHFGFFVSGAMNMYLPIKSDTYTLSDEELIFEQVKGKHKWRGIG